MGECTGPFDGFPEIMSVDYPRQAKMTGLGRTTNTTMNTVAGTSVAIMTGIGRLYKQK
jgi:hypothetical protein